MSTVTIPLSLSSPFMNPNTISSSCLLPPHSLHSPSLSPHFHFLFSLSSKPTIPSSSSTFRRLQYTDEDEDEDDDHEQQEQEDHIIGDCLIFEDGIFDDPYLKQENEDEDGVQDEPIKSLHKNKNKNKKPVKPEVDPQNLVPDEWKRAVDEINITKKERRKIAQEFQYGQRLDRKKRESLPLRVNLEEYLRYREDKLSQVKPLLLDTPKIGLDIDDDDDIDDEETGLSSSSGGLRVEPKNPRWAVYGRSLEDITDFFNAGDYQPHPAHNESNSEGRRKLFTKEEKALISAKKPNLAAATSLKWLPLHTLAASGEFYLATTLLKHDVSINAVDNDGLTALHKAIICKKQAITSFLLRESANPFIRDKDGATLMHYAVRTASSNAIKTLLLYNVNINLQDNDGWTPLHLAVQGKRTDVVRLLLIKGADKTLKNKDGLTPLELCLYSGQDRRTYELIRLLKQLARPHRSLY